MQKEFSFSTIEKKINDYWLKNNFFKDKIQERQQKYSTLMPPPNVTGRLHMGHALNNTIQDVIIRFKRMMGYDVEWIPGADHAGIATQTVVKKELDQQKIDYRKIGREEFTKHIWQWKQKYGDIIIEQLKQLGISCNWEKTFFTMDDFHCKSVNHAFEKLYKEGYIYRGKRIVNWCPVDKTALSDDEIETKPEGEDGFFYCIRYYAEDKKDSLTVATTRPETLFGDVCLAVNPKDKKYKNWIGKKVWLPIVEKLIPVVADEYVDSNFGTGCVKITPAHDPNDFEVGNRHGFEPINIMNEDASLNQNVPKDYQNLTRYQARKKLLEELKQSGNFIKEEPKKIPVGRSYRSNAVIEYRLSDQWFVKMQPLVKKVREHLENNPEQKLNFFPQRIEKVYNYWLDNIRDWCISRQIWWGHRIPVWYCNNEEYIKNNNGNKIIVGEENFNNYPFDKEKDLQKEQDVLDTWFSSALLPLSVFTDFSDEDENVEDKKNKEEKKYKYFPTNFLSTGKDILFFWVARMVMMSVFFKEKLPFENVFFHSTVMDEKGRTMSKSKGNGIDPLHIINGATCDQLKNPIHDAKPSNMKELLNNIDKKYGDGFIGVGADALRYTLIYLSSKGQEMHLSFDNFIEIGRRFVTKLWNARRFLKMNLCEFSPLTEQEKQQLENLKTEEFSKKETHEYKEKITDEQSRPYEVYSDLQIYDKKVRWIEIRANEFITNIKKFLNEFNFSKLGLEYYNFIWSDFCDWYVEMIKTDFADKNSFEAKKVMNYSLEIFNKILIALHPITPFITEELWQKINSEAVNKNFPVVDFLKDNELLEGKQISSISVAPFPEQREFFAGQFEVTQEFEFIKKSISQIRSLRKKYNIPEKEKLSLLMTESYKINYKRFAKMFTDNLEIYQQLAGIEKINFVAEKPSNCATILNSEKDYYFEIYINIEKFIDTDKERERLQKELQKINKDLQILEKKIANENFKKAKPVLWQSEEQKYILLKDKKIKIENEFNEL